MLPAGVKLVSEISGYLVAVLCMEPRYQMILPAERLDTVQGVWLAPMTKGQQHCGMSGATPSKAQSTKGIRAETRRQ